MDKEYCDKVNDKMTKKPKKPKYNKLSDLFDVKNTHKMPNGETHTGKTHTKKSKLIKCPKGHKICRCKKKPKCVKIKK